MKLGEDNDGKVRVARSQRERQHGREGWGNRDDDMMDDSVVRKVDCKRAMFSPTTRDVGVV